MSKKEEDLKELFENIRDIKERNKKIVKAYKKGYSQHLIAKVLGVSQPAVSGVIRRSR
jgi:DNA-directed RNA polymerase specialized sigma subunit